MVKKIAGAAVVIVALIGLYTLYSAGRQAVVDYQNFRKIVLWVAQKQNQEAQALQRQQQQQQQRAQQQAAPSAPAAVPQQ
jgi:Sec-independent protein translocase protein TatA